MGIRAFSTSCVACKDISSTSSSDLVVFLDADKDKLDILNHIKGKSGIYMWTNKLNSKKYVGSSVDLNRRLLEYYNVNRLLNENSMPINVALLKYGYHNFSLTILDICDIDNLMSREKHFFEVYSPEYNILKTPGSPSRGSGWKHSEATVENMRAAALKRSPETLAKMSASQSMKIKVEVTDIETNTSTIYHAIKAAARALGIDKRYIEHYIYLNQDKPVLGKYTFKLLDTEGQFENQPNIGKVQSEGSVGLSREGSTQTTFSAAIKVQKTSKKVEVTNVETKEVTIYPSIGAAARVLGYRFRFNLTKNNKGSFNNFKQRY